MSSTLTAVPLDLPPVNEQIGRISEPFLMTLRPLPDLMRKAVATMRPEHH